MVAPLSLSASFETYVIGLRSLPIFYTFGAGIDSIRHNPTPNVGPRAERVKQNMVDVCSLTLSVRGPSIDVRF